METLLKFNVDNCNDDEWYNTLQDKMMGISKKWRSADHITAVFLDDDKRKEELKVAFDSLLRDRRAPHLTFNKLEAFTGRSGNHYVCLTSDCPEPEFVELVAGLRQKANLSMDDFRLHVTLAEVKAKVCSLEDLQKRIAPISMSEFTRALMSVDFRYLGGPNIKRWELKS